MKISSPILLFGWCKKKLEKWSLSVCVMLCKFEVYKYIVYSNVKFQPKWEIFTIEILKDPYIITIPSPVPDVNKARKENASNSHQYLETKDKRIGFLMFYSAKLKCLSLPVAMMDISSTWPSWSLLFRWRVLVQLGCFVEISLITDDNKISFTPWLFKVTIKCTCMPRSK